MTAAWVILNTMSRPASAFAAAATGCYEAPRAAALSGVPVRTVYDWATKDVVVPSVSPVQEKLWSYADLMALRIVAWLRRPKFEDDDHVDTLKGSPMGQVKAALAMLDQHGLDLWARDTGNASPLVVDRFGRIHVRAGDRFLDLRGDESFPEAEDWLDLLGPFDVAGHRGPDLLSPRPRLRIAPERVAGEPHVQNTRLTTRTLAGLSNRGFSTGRIVDMYSVSREAVEEAVDFESSLSVA